MGLKFGTDGVRGKVNEWPMTAELVQKLAISAGSVYLGKGGSNLNRVVFSLFVDPFSLKHLLIPSILT